MDMELQNKILELKGKEDEIVGQAAPFSKNGFSKNILNKLVVAWNKVRPLFGIQEDYPAFIGPVKEFPVDFVKLLLMVKQAVDDAISDEIISEQPLELSSIVNDSTLALFANRLLSLAKNRDLKDYLMSAPEQSEQMETKEDEPVREEAPSMIDEKLSNLLMTRMRK